MLKDLIDEGAEVVGLYRDPAFIRAGPREDAAWVGEGTCNGIGDVLVGGGALLEFHAGAHSFLICCFWSWE